MKGLICEIRLYSDSTLLKTFCEKLKNFSGILFIRRDDTERQQR